MFISFFDDLRLTDKTVLSNQKKLNSYRTYLSESEATNKTDIPEYSLYQPKDFALHETLHNIKKKYKAVKHVVLVGIGGSSLGLEAIHAVLDKGATKLSVLDAVSAAELSKVLSDLSSYKKSTQIAICVISKSGNTTETLTNAAVLIDSLVDEFGESFYQQVVIVGNPGTTLMKEGKKLRAELVFMPEIIGGRYSVATLVGLVPLTLLGHDVDEFVSGYLDSNLERFESLTAESAARIQFYIQSKYHHYNFFAFEPRLALLGAWYRQLFAESLGKETDLAGQPHKHAMVPTISTPIDLHSIGQLYMSGVTDTYTDFVSFDDELVDFKISKKNKLSGKLKGKTLQEIATALYGGVISAYEDRQLPYRATIFEESLPYSLGLFMGMRLREVMYVAHLQNVNAFNQPNVELYKTKTKEILGL